MEVERRGKRGGEAEAGAIVRHRPVEVPRDLRLRRLRRLVLPKVALQEPVHLALLLVLLVLLVLLLVVLLALLHVLLPPLLVVVPALLLVVLLLPAHLDGEARHAAVPLARPANLAAPLAAPAAQQRRARGSLAKLTERARHLRHHTPRQEPKLQP